jgi:SAM-dependent methyltransferase
MTKQSNIIFPFGKNWQKFIGSLNKQTILSAENSLKEMLKVENLTGKRFLDAGCGSGIFSLAALRLGADEVVSFDIDEDSVACAKYLKKRFGPLPQWHITTGSVLNRDFLSGLNKFDVVYSWGVLHHTGKMWNALSNIIIPVAHKGALFISIYNDQGKISKLWKWIKYMYNISPGPIKILMAGGYCSIAIAVKAGQSISKLHPPSKWFEYGNDRGMNIWYDAVDWIGGYPFETATPEQIISFYHKRNFNLMTSNTKTGSGCNEFVLIDK